jgi:hypothetical protein
VLRYPLTRAAYHVAFPPSSRVQRWQLFRVGIIINALGAEDFDAVIDLDVVISSGVIVNQGPDFGLNSSDLLTVAK